MASQSLLPPWETDWLARPANNGSLKPRCIRPAGCTAASLARLPSFSFTLSSSSSSLLQQIPIVLCSGLRHTARPAGRACRKEISFLWCSSLRMGCCQETLRRAADAYIFCGPLHAWAGDPEHQALSLVQRLETRRRSLPVLHLECCRLDRGRRFSNPLIIPDVTHHETL